MRLAGIEPAEKFPPEGAATGSVSDKLPAWALVAAVGTGAAVDGSQAKVPAAGGGKETGQHQSRDQGTRTNSPPVPGNRIYLATSETRSASRDGAKGGQRGKGRLENKNGQVVLLMPAVASG